MENVGTQADINTLIAAFAAASIAVNGFFLKSVATQLKEMAATLGKHGNRLTRLEAWNERHDNGGEFPRRRRGERATDDCEFPRERNGER